MYDHKLIFSSNDERLRAHMYLQVIALFKNLKGVKGARTPTLVFKTERALSGAWQLQIRKACKPLTFKFNVDNTIPLEQKFTRAGGV